MSSTDYDLGERLIRSGVEGQARERNFAKIGESVPVAAVALMG
jgi:hypothetical protein